ncbi:PAS domain-containing protein [Pseudomonas prosekii]|uniref:PAS domain-containing protein n=1 Tax=Pseudomonas prosekii TaxID=1148509 RepID=UPI0011EB2B65|nr:PAS domain-containing protein [Pseudomonas prosekii]
MDRSTATIEFKPDGTIVNANENLLTTMGYRLEEILGQHHRILCFPEYQASADYRRLAPFDRKGSRRIRRWWCKPG